LRVVRRRNMTDFECRYGHYVRSGEDCKACEAEGRFGERAFYMDGLSSSAWRKKEQYEEEQALREDAKDAEDDRS
jgi:hypothetical protein